MKVYPMAKLPAWPPEPRRPISMPQSRRPFAPRILLGEASLELGGNVRFGNSAFWFLDSDLWILRTTSLCALAFQRPVLIAHCSSLIALRSSWVAAAKLPLFSKAIRGGEGFRRPVRGTRIEGCRRQPSTETAGTDLLRIPRLPLAIAVAARDAGSIGHRSVIGVRARFRERRARRRRANGLRVPFCLACR